LKKSMLIMGIVIVVIVMPGVGAWEYHKQPQFCATCHIMQPYLDSSQQPSLLAYSHAEDGNTCLDCHEATIGEQIQEVVQYVKRDYETPLKRRKFPKEFCLLCHDYEIDKETIQRAEDSPHLSDYGETGCYFCHTIHR